jgi:predicted phosphodiesterase
MVIAVLADIHSNLEAMRSVLDDMQTRSVEAVFFIGDLTGWGPRPNECIALFQELGKRIPCYAIAGNHDLAVAGVTSGSNFTEAAFEVLSWERKEISRENREWLTSLPRIMKAGNRSQYLIVHGSPSDPMEEYILGVQQMKFALQDAADAEPGIEMVIVGHTHIPFIFDGNKYVRITDFPAEIRLVPGTRVLVNPGSVGQPRDGISMAAYAVIDEERQIIRFIRTGYDIVRTQEDMRNKGFSEPVVRRLMYGR